MNENVVLGSKVVNELRSKHPLYGALLARINVHCENKFVLTMGIYITHTINLGVNLDFYQGLKHAERLAVVEHELLHVINQHPLRFESLFHSIANRAADMAINQYIENLPTDCIKLHTGWKPFQTMEYYYKKMTNDKELWKNIDIKIIDADGAGGSGGMQMSGIDKLPKDHPLRKKVEEALEKHYGKMQNSHSMWNKKCSAQQKSTVKNTLNDSAIDSNMKQPTQKSSTAQTSQTSKMKGDTPAMIERALAPILRATKINWRTILNGVIAQKMSEERIYTLSRKHRRYGTIPGFLPKTTLKVLLGMDTSGSIDEELLSVFAQEIYKIVNLGFSVEIVECDAKIHRKYKLKTRQKITRPIGGGGTDFRPVFEYARTSRPDILIYFTDGYGDYPKARPSYPVIWALSEEYQTPWGKKLMLSV